MSKHRISQLILALLIPVPPAAAQEPQSTRFTIAGAPMLSQPKEGFRQNVGNGFGGGGALLYRLDKTGVLSLRFDVSGLAYGRETKRVPLSELVGARILVDATTTNSIAAFSFGPELAIPIRAVRPYVNAAVSGLLFRTSSSVKGTGLSSEPIASTTNYSDSTRAWVFGGGVRIPIPRGGPNLRLDIGIRYYRGGEVSYLREGSIQDRPDGSISISPLTSRTPYMAYLIGIRYRIPFKSPGPCPRLLC